MSEFNNPATHPASKPPYFWIGTSVVLLVLCIVFAVFNPFGKSSTGASETVATVNGVKITKDQLYDEMYAQGGSSLLESLINLELVNQEAESNNVTVTEADVDAELERQAAATGMGVEEMLQMFNIYYGFSEETLRSEMEQQVKIRKLLAPRLEITDEEIETYYNDHIDEFYQQEQVRASHILVETKEEAEEIIAQLNEGADFAELAQEKGTDGTASRGGDLSYFPRGQMVKEFEDAAFSMEIGEITDEPVETDFGYHVIMKTDHLEEKTLSLEEAKEDIYKILEDEKMYSLSQAWIAEVREKANIQYTEA